MGLAMESGPTRASRHTVHDLTDAIDKDKRLRRKQESRSRWQLSLLAGVFSFPSDNPVITLAAALVY